MNKLLSYKLFTKIAIFIVVFVFLFHFIIWNLYTKHVFPNDYFIGDLGRISYQINYLHPRVTHSDLAKQHINFHQWNGEQVDILTIGDSIANGGAGGLNPFFQDYIATYYDKTVLNIQPLDYNYIEMIYLLLNNGMLDEISPKVIIIESTERSVIERFTANINDNIYEDSSKIKNKLRQAHWKNDIEKDSKSFLNSLNLNALLYNLFYNLDDNAYLSACYLTNLSKKVFSVQDGQTLMFYKDYIKYNKSLNIQSIKAVNNNFNELARKLKDKNIDLYFMPAVDKFNLYSKYVIDNKYGDSVFFEEIRQMEKDYYLIDTKAILEKEIDNGVLDIFYIDDTHWSYKASEAIVRSLNYL